MTPKPDTKERIEKVLQELMPKFIWGYVCPKCGGGGGDGHTNCSKCNGTGITDWQTDGFSDALIREGVCFKSDILVELLAGGPNDVPRLFSKRDVAFRDAQWRTYFKSKLGGAK